MTTLTDPWAPTPQVIVDFGWYNASIVVFSNLTYIVNNITYPPAGASYQAYATATNQPVIFDAIDPINHNLGIASTIVPTGVTVVSYTWNLGNGQISTGPVVSTSYNYTTAPPDMAVTLTTVDSLGRSRSCTKELNLQGLAQTGGSVREQQGTGRV